MSLKIPKNFTILSEKDKTAYTTTFTITPKLPNLKAELEALQRALDKKLFTTESNTRLPRTARHQLSTFPNTIIVRARAV